MKLLKVALLSLLAFCVAALALVLYFGHPNDQRISMPALDEWQASHQYEAKVAALFQSPFPASLDLDKNAYQAALEDLQKARPDLRLAKPSRHLAQPYQSYLALGSYPDRLEGRTGLLIPSGHTLRLNPGLGGRVRLEFAATALTSPATLELSNKGRLLKSKDLLPLPPPSQTPAWRLFLQHYSNPDTPAEEGGWQPFSTRFQIERTDELLLSCRGEEGSGCFLSEPQFWQHSIEPKPNILFILVDTLRYDAIDPQTTPTLYHFKKRSVDFRQAVAAGNMTSPSTNALLSGRKPTHLGELAFSYSLSHEAKERYYAQGKASLPQLLTQAGWQTAMIGNISVLSEVLGVSADHGFEQDIAIERPAYDTPRITREAMHWLKANGQKPFFLYLHYHAPHAPYRAPLRDIWATFPGFKALLSYADVLRWLYKAEVRYTDRYAAQVLATLQKMQLFEQTTVVITADHGDHHEVRTFTDNESGEAFTGTFFDHGATLYQDEVRVPLMIKEAWTPHRHQVDQRVSGLDLAPTLLALAGLEIPPWFDGLSLKAALQQASPVPALTQRVFGIEAFDRRAILWKGRYKLIRQYKSVEKRLYPPASYRTVPSKLFSEYLLFDLRHDPGETNNLAHTHPHLFAEGKKHFEAYYHEQEGYELVIDNPERLSVTLELGPQILVEPGPCQVQSAEGKTPPLLLCQNGEKRYRFYQRTAFNPLPRVSISGKPLALTYTAARLPLQAAQTALPREPRGEENLWPVGKSPMAYIRKVETSEVEQRKIVAENPEFEKILKEWGYVNDEG